MADYQQLFGTRSPVALVTGAGAPRIGNCIVRSLAERGFQTAVHARGSIEAAKETAAQLSKQSAGSIAVAAELRDEGEVQKMIRHVVDHFGRLDVLVNSAAIWQSQPLEQVSAADVLDHFQVNTLGTFLCCQHAGLQMVNQTCGGAIINLGDWAPQRPYSGYAAYFASKGSIPTLTRNFAIELGSRNSRIRVNAILPGPAMIPESFTPEQRKRTIEQTLLKREGHPQNVADAAIALIENDFVTGVCLPVDGGRSIFAAGESD